MSLLVLETLPCFLVSCSLFTWSKQKWLFWGAGFFPANQSFLNIFSIALIGWIQKCHFCFDRVNRLCTVCERDWLQNVKEFLASSQDQIDTVPRAFAEKCPGEGSNRKKDWKRALLSLFLLYLCHVWKSSEVTPPADDAHACTGPFPNSLPVCFNFW